MDALPSPPPALIAASPSAEAKPVQAPPPPAETKPVPAPGILDFLPKRDPNTAALLSLAVNGAGQFYNGEPAKGWWMLAPWALYPVAWVADEYLQTGYFRTGVVVLGLGTKGYSVWDAYFTAAKAREERP